MVEYVFELSYIEKCLKNNKNSIDLSEYRSLEFRPLAIDDFDKGYIELLSKLTNVGNISKMDFKDQFHKMKQSSNYFILVIEDLKSSKIVGSSTLVIEHKFIYGCSNRGRIEDVIVDPSKRNQKLGSIMLKFLIDIAKDKKCYKVTLEGRHESGQFYPNAGFSAVKDHDIFELRF